MAALLILKEMAKMFVKIPIVICLWIALLTVSVVHGLYQLVHIIYWLILIIGLIACLFDQYWYGAVGLIVIAVISAVNLGLFGVIEAGIQELMHSVMAA